MRIEAPHTDELWSLYLDCRYRNLYEPFGLARDVTTSELDSPRVRPEVLHRVVMAGDRVASCGRLDLQPGHGAGPSAQLRYFAVDAPFRGTGAGQYLMEHFETEARALGLARLWMEARTSAANFYARQGYLDVGEGPTKHGVIPHRIMEKRFDAPGS